MTKPELTQTRLQSLLNYDEATGLFTWMVYHGGTSAPGVPAGCTDKAGRIWINVDGRRYSAHRLAWLYVFGNWPKHGLVLDHMHGMSNAISNLREVPQYVNTQNKKRAQSNNKVGMLGVNKIRSGYRARIKPHGKKAVHLGVFPTPLEAHAAYVAAKRVLHEGGLL